MPRLRASIVLVLLSALTAAGCASTPCPAPADVADSGSDASFEAESPYRPLDELGKGEIVHLPTGRSLSEAELWDFLAGHRVIYVSEAHDSVEAHAIQLATMKAMVERFGGKVAVGMEMLRRGSQAEVDAWLAGELDEKSFRRVWDRDWGSYPYYREILQTAKALGVPLVALNADKEEVQAARDSAAAGGEAAVDPYYRRYVDAMFAGHPGHGDMSAMKERFSRVQSLWDETMAESAAAWLSRPEHAQDRLIVFAGGGHIERGIGIPRRLFRKLPLPYAILTTITVEIPEHKKAELMDVDVPALPLPLADVAWGTGYEDLEDRRVRLGATVSEVEGGLRVDHVAPEGPGAKAGLAEGDVLLSLDGQALETRFDLTYELDEHKPGDESTLVVRRGEETKELELVHGAFRSHHPR